MRDVIVRTGTPQNESDATTIGPFPDLELALKEIDNLAGDVLQVLAPGRGKQSLG